MNENAKRLMMDVIAARHDPDAVQDTIQRHIENITDADDLIYNLALSLMGVTQALHQTCHLAPNIDRMVDTIVSAGPSAINAQFAEALTPERLLSDEYTRHVFDDLTEGTNPADRLWSVSRMPNGQKTVTLNGSQMNERVFIVVGASEDDLDQFLDRMIAYEKELK